MVKKKRKNVTHDEDPFLSLTEVGRQIGKAPQTVRRWVQDGLILGERRPNGIYAVRQSVVNEFLGGSALEVEVIGDPDSAANTGVRDNGSKTMARESQGNGSS